MFLKVATKNDHGDLDKQIKINTYQQKTLTKLFKPNP